MRGLPFSVLLSPSVHPNTSEKKSNSAPPPLVVHYFGIDADGHVIDPGRERRRRHEESPGCTITLLGISPRAKRSMDTITSLSVTLSGSIKASKGNEPPSRRSTAGWNP